VSDLGEVLELLHGARARYRTVRGVLRHWSSLRLSQEARERWAAEVHAAGHSAGTTYAEVMVVDQPASEPPDRHELAIRFWSDPPARLREETTNVAPQPHEHVLVRDGDRWWTYSPEWGAVSNVVTGEEVEQVMTGGGELWETLLDPSVWIPALDFELEGRGEQIGRPALRVRATGRVPRGNDPFLFRAQLAVGADEYRLLIDRERGVVLRVAALLEGEEFWVSQFDELVFDEKLGRETFVFTPPSGVEIRAPDIGVHEAVTIEEAARRASFPVFYIPELPEGRWDLHVMYAAPRELPPLEESVHLAYHRADATHHVMVTERAATEREPAWVRYARAGLQVEELEREGRLLTVYRPERRRHGIPLTVVVDRDGTALELSSANLEEEVLLRLAASMERLRAP
jgi:outer membrane lipoprotein-sorting protein